MVKNILLVAVVLWVSIIFFAPKRELYYLLEHQLKKEGIVFDGEQVGETPLGLKIGEGKLFIDGVEVATVKKIVFRSFLFYSRIEIRGFQGSSFSGETSDLQLSRITMEHGIWHPFSLSLSASGRIGTLRGKVDFRKKRMILRWEKEGALSSLKDYLKRDSRGWYFERKF